MAMTTRSSKKQYVEAYHSKTKTEQNSLCVVATYKENNRKKLRYFRLPPNLAQRKLIDLANHTPSFMPYKAVVIACEFLKVGVQWRPVAEVHASKRSISKRLFGEF